MPAPSPSAAPPNFYDSLPAGAADSAPAPKGKSDSDDVDGDVLKALAGCYRVLTKVADMKDTLKGGVAKIKDDLKALVVQGLKKDPSSLESGGDTASEKPPAAAPPKSTDETHAA